MKVLRDESFTDLVSRNDTHQGLLQRNLFRAGRYNLPLARNDLLIKHSEAHLLFVNLGNIDSRPLISLWLVLEYLTKPISKSGKGSKQLTTLFDNVLSDMCAYEQEDGISDLWRRTILRVYNRVVGDRDCTLFQVVRLGLQLPAVVSSFGDVSNASLSGYRAVKIRADSKICDDDDNVCSSHGIGL